MKPHSSTILPSIGLFLTGIVTTLLIISLTIALPTALTSAHIYLTSHAGSSSSSSAFCRTGALNYPLVAREEPIIKPPRMLSRAFRHGGPLQSRTVALSGALNSASTPSAAGGGGHRLVLSRSLPSNFVVEPAVMAGIVGAVALGIAGLML